MGGIYGELKLLSRSQFLFFVIFVTTSLFLLILKQEPLESLVF